MLIFLNVINLNISIARERWIPASLNSAKDHLSKLFWQTSYYTGVEMMKRVLPCKISGGARTVLPQGTLFVSPPFCTYKTIVASCLLFAKLLLIWSKTVLHAEGGVKLNDIWDILTSMFCNGKSVEGVIWSNRECQIPFCQVQMLKRPMEIWLLTLAT